MPRRVLSILLVALAALAACQDYNFNPVGKCVIQPGAKREEVEKIGIADVLFVVDDSGSMRPEQERLKANFGAFIDALARVQQERAQNNLDPFEFHIAVTTSAVFEAWKLRASSPQVTCAGSPLQCAIPAQTSYYQIADNATCANAGEVCNDLIDYYAFDGSPVTGPFECSNPGVGTTLAPYPAGDFVALGSNARVLHFTKDLEWAGWPDAAPNLSALVQQFKDNIAVGACGSGMEQPFEAARLALKKAARQDGLEQPVPQSEFLHDQSKLVVVFVGDEDDCSNPDDPTRSLAFLMDDGSTSTPGADVCLEEQLKPESEQKLFPVSEYASFLTGLGRPFSAAFVYSAKLDSCQKDGNGNVVCEPGACDCQCPTHCFDPPGTGCGPDQPGDCFAPGAGQDKCAGFDPFADRSRYHKLSEELRSITLSDGSKVNTFEASVCQADWAETLRGIARLVSPPSGLTLATLPADKDVVALSVQDANGNPRFCVGPCEHTLAGCTADQDWWFVECEGDPPRPTETPSATATKCIRVNPDTSSLSAKCQPNPGETYIAFYLGKVPDAGCFSNQECSDVFHSTNTTAAFECQGFSGTRDGGGTAGTCICK